MANCPEGQKRNTSEEKESLVWKKGTSVTKPLSKFLEAEPMDDVEEVTGLEVASALGQMSQGELQEVADNAPLEVVASSAPENPERI